MSDDDDKSFAIFTNRPGNMTPAVQAQALESKREFMKSLVQLEKRHGKEKMAFALSIYNSEIAFDMMKSYGVPTPILKVVRTAFEHAFLSWGRLVQGADPETMQAIVTGLHEQMNYVRSDFEAALKTTTGEQDGTPTPKP